MIQPKKKICRECQQITYIWSHGLCKYCASKTYKTINKMSDKKRDEAKILKTIYQIMDSNPYKKCFFCGTTQNLEHVHLIRRSENEDLITNPMNIVLGCRECHHCFDDLPKERMSLPNADKAMERIELLDFKYYNRLIENSDEQR